MEQIRVQLPDGSIKEVVKGTTVEDVARGISPRLLKAAVCGIVNDVKIDLSFPLEQDCSLTIVTIDSEEGLDVLRHTVAHIMAQAVRRLWPDTKLGIGPTIENGFYYDFDLKHSFTPEDLTKIEAEMEKIIQEDLLITREEISLEEAKKLFTDDGEVYKLELIDELKDQQISVYRQGEFYDLCRGPHLNSTGKVKAFKLLNVAGAYWRGDSERPMLQRIYGTAFPKKSELDEYLVQLEEAKKRDHNKLGRELELFTTSELVGQGLPLMMPKGAKVLQILQRFVEDEEEKRGYLMTKTPFMSKKDLFEQSGHWEHYQDGMFKVPGDDEDDMLALRPMTCPFQFLIYKSKLRSYRELPIRYAETSTLFRNESSGEMHGLIRVRQFTISEGHLICTNDQVESEFKGALDLINFMLDTLGLREDVWYRLSKWDPDNKDKYIGSPEAWERTQEQMRNILDSLGLEYKEAEGEAAFYGPKLDIQARNVHGKEDTIITVQIDFSLPERLDLSYVDRDGEKKRPIVIHRTSIGCYERTLAMLIEKYAGAFPTWLAPIQVKVLPVSDDFVDYAKETAQKLQYAGIRVEVDTRPEKIGYKIRGAQMQKVPYMLVVGAKEKDNNLVAVRHRKEGDIGQMSANDFIGKIIEEIATKKLD
ncbi:MAG: threonine--tRNA ligase [Firmicutes bacterium]|nr:threonine--tRNA ligase [Bacillota bacterium]